MIDMERAVSFYKDVFGATFERQIIDGYDMALFPRADDQPGASGALVRGDVYKPSQSGCILYFDVADIDVCLKAARAHGAQILYPKTDLGAAGHVAEIEDSEGNRIALSQANAPR
ncbi:MAG: VOC family protein [Pseudomonadota bacterium]